MDLSRRIWSHLAIPSTTGSCPVGVYQPRHDSFSTCGSPLDLSERVEIETDFYPGAKFEVVICAECGGLSFPGGEKWGKVWQGDVDYYNATLEYWRCPFCQGLHNRDKSIPFSINTREGVKQGVFCPECHQLAFIWSMHD